MIELITEEIDLKNNTNNNTNSKTNSQTNNKTKNNVNQILKDNYQDIQETNQIQQKNYVDKLYDQYYQFKKNFINLVKRNRRTLKVILILLIVLTILETYQHFTLSGIQIGNQIVTILSSWHLMHINNLTFSFEGRFKSMIIFTNLFPI